MLGFFKKLISRVFGKRPKRSPQARPASGSMPPPAMGKTDDGEIPAPEIKSKPKPQPPKGGNGARPLSAADYAAQKKTMVSEDVALRHELARSCDTHPEILYYLSADRDAGVRLAVAENSATPLQANALLAKDPSVDVRLALAARLMDLLPGLSDDQQSQLYAFTVQALGILAEDEVLKIRKALASALKDFAKAPPKVAGQLARDIEREVSEPILRFCVALADDDLLDILSGHPEPWVISAIAGRPAVSEAVSQGVVDTGDVPAGAVLLKNAGAVLSEDTLRAIVERARTLPEWHEPVIMRRELSLDIALRLSGFVSEAVMSLLERRTDFDAATRQVISGMVARRVEYKKETAHCKTPDEQVDYYIKKGRLTPDTVRDALSWDETEFAIAALSKMARIHPHIVRKMLATRAAKAVVALCWLAGLPMRLAIDIQRDLGRVPLAEILYAKGGTDYPLGQDEIRWQLEFFGVDAGSAPGGLASS